MADNVEEELGKAGYPCKQVEGYQSANWILMDYGDIIVHVFDKESRLFYDIERIWRDGKVMDAKELKEVSSQNTQVLFNSFYFRNIPFIPETRDAET